jgi:adhesin transport system outer membrane protein
MVQRKFFKYYNDRNYKFILSQNIYSGGETSNTIKSLEKKLKCRKKPISNCFARTNNKSNKSIF